MNKKKLILYMLANLLLLIILVFCNVKTYKIYQTVYDHYNETVLSDKIYDGVIVKQTFKSFKNSKKFSIRIGTYRHFYKSGKIIIYITDLTTNESKKLSIKCSSLDDRGDSIIDYSLKKNHLYEMTISTNGVSDENSFILYSTSYTNENDYDLYINNEEKDYNLIIGYLNLVSTKPDYYILLLYSSVNICILSLYTKRRNQ